MKINSLRLFQRRIDVRELRVEGSAESIDCSDNGKADARSDQAVFDRGSARLIGPKLRNKFFHRTSCTHVTQRSGSLGQIVRLIH